MDTKYETTFKKEDSEFLTADFNTASNHAARIKIEQYEYGSTIKEEIGFETTQDYQDALSERMKIKVEDYTLQSTDQGNSRNEDNVLSTESIYLSCTKCDIQCQEEPKDKEPTFRCLLCRGTFSKVTDLFQHGCTKGEMTCGVCAKVLFKTDEVRYHRKMIICIWCGRHNCSREMSLKCCVCDKTYDNLQSLSYHLRFYKWYKCHVCGETFNLKCKLERHLRNHFGDTPFKSCVSGKVFTHHFPMTVHVNARSCRKPYRCSLCRKRFMRQIHLKFHYRVHIGKPYKCHSCDKTFVSKAMLKIHSRIHTGVKPYECGVCFATFAYKSNLNRHSHTHSGQRLHKCHVCRKYFRFKSSLDIHSRSHSGVKLYKCGVCSKAFPLKSLLNKHIVVHTPPKCHVCEKQFDNEEALIVHKRVHSDPKPFKCPVCGKTFASKDALRICRIVHSRN